MTGKESLFLRIGDHVIKGDLKVNKRKRILNLLEDMGDHKRVRFMPISLEAFQSLEDLNELVVNANNCIQMELNEGISPIAFLTTQTRVSAIKFGDFGGVYLHVYPQYELTVRRLHIIENCLKMIFSYYLIPE